MSLEHPLPSSWAWASLADVAASKGGGTPPKSEPSYWSGGNLPWVSPKDMKSFVITATEDKLTNQALERLSLIPSDSVLVVVRSGILSRTLPVAISNMPLTVNQDMRAFVPEAEINARYLAWQMAARERDILSACSKHGTTVASIEGPALARFPLAIAPATEQTRIVAKLEELLSDLDAGVAELKAAQKKLALYRQSLLKAAVEGALTAEWRAARESPPSPSGRGAGGEGETGAQLLDRILRERRRRWEEKQLAKFKEQGKTPPKNWQDKYPEPVQPDTTGLPQLPDGWVWASVDQLAAVGTGVTPLRSKKAYFNEGTIPWVTSGALNSETVTAAAEFVTELALKECRLEVYPLGALLVAMYGEGKTRGKCSELLIPATINQAIAAIVLGPEALPCKDYVKAFLLDSYERMRAQASGGVQPNLNLQIVKSIVLPLPPVTEQVEISRRLDTQFGEIARQQTAVGLGLKQSAAQRKNILKAAFSGQLVPQDPNDEPASVLLERIRAGRAAQAAVKGPRGRKRREKT